MKPESVLPRSLEHRLKFDLGLSVGAPHLITITHKWATRKALVRIGRRGAVSLLFEPRPGEMYSSWSRITGDTYSKTRSDAVIVWAARNPEILAQFQGAPVADVPLDLDDGRSESSKTFTGDM